MKEEIVLNNVSFNYQNKLVIDNLNMKIRKGNFITILGEIGSGKTTIIKILQDKLKYSGTIKVNKRTEFVSFNSRFNYDTVANLLKTSSKKKDIIELLGLENILNYNPNFLSNSDKAKVIIASSLLKDTDVLIFDDILSLIKEDSRLKVFNYLKKVNKEEKITIVNITSNTEDCLYSKQVAIIKDGKVLKSDKTKEILKDEKLFKEANLEFPFIADLSLKISYYGLIDKPILDIDKMVNELWK